MKKTLFTLALTLAVVGTVGGKALAQDSTTGDGSPVLGSYANVSDSALGNTLTKTKTDIDDSYNTKTITDNDTITKTKVDDSYNTLTDNDTITKTKTDIDDSYNTKTINKTKVEDSYWTQSTTGDASPNVNKGKIDDSNFATQYSTGALSPVMQDSDIKDSTFVNGAQDNSYESHNVFTQTGQLNAANSDVYVGNLAGNDSTILDGDITLGYLPGYPTPVDAAASGLIAAPGWGGLDVNVNTGIMTDSIMGNYNQQANGAGVATNGNIGKDASVNSTQTSNLNVFGQQ
jgi:hypothetical protein